VEATADLAYDARRADALVTVHAQVQDGAAPAPRAAEVLIMDRSLSMAALGKLDAAKEAVCAAVDSVRDGTYLGIVAGHHEAEVLWPPGGRLVPVDAAAKAAAKRRIRGRLPEGGTAIGSWLTCARDLFATVPAEDTVRHAVLYTDGKDEHETPEELGAVLAACRDRFVCDARGLGEDWDYAELLRITAALHGHAKAVIAVSDLTRDLTELMAQARLLVVPRTYLGLRLNEHFTLGFVRQTLPVQADLTGRPEQRDGELHIPLGAWSAGVRQYQVSLRFDPEALEVDEDLRAARITLRTERDGERPACAESRPMAVRRRSTPGSRTLVPDSLTRVESERELGMAMRACADAWQARDTVRADHELRLALELAERLGDTVRLRLLRSVAEADAEADADPDPDGDPGGGSGSGPPRLRPDVTRGEMQRLGLDSTRTGTARPGTGLPHDPAGPVPSPAPSRVRCPRCGTTTTAAVLLFCENCGARLGAEVRPEAPDGGGRPDGVRDADGPGASGRGFPADAS
jgi:Ca-activated chloride channel family protein